MRDRTRPAGIKTYAVDYQLAPEAKLRVRDRLAARVRGRPTSRPGKDRGRRGFRRRQHDLRAHAEIPRRGWTASRPAASALSGDGAAVRHRLRQPEPRRLLPRDLRRPAVRVELRSPPRGRPPAPDLTALRPLTRRSAARDPHHQRLRPAPRRRPRVRPQTRRRRERLPQLAGAPPFIAQDRAGTSPVAPELTNIDHRTDHQLALETTDNRLPFSHAKPARPRMGMPRSPRMAVLHDPAVRRSVSGPIVGVSERGSPARARVSPSGNTCGRYDMVCG